MMNTDTGKAAETALLELGMGGSDNEAVSIDSLADLTTLASGVDLAIWHQVRVLRHRGIAWEQIGKALGVSRQAAQQRYGG